MQELANIPGVLSLKVSPPNGHAYCSLDLTVDHPDLLIPNVVHRLAQAGGKVLEVKKLEPSLGEAIETLGREG
jgi:hypothetical protein